MPTRTHGANSHNAGAKTYDRVVVLPLAGLASPRRNDELDATVVAMGDCLRAPRGQFHSTSVHSHGGWSTDVVSERTDGARRATISVCAGWLDRSIVTSPVAAWPRPTGCGRGPRRATRSHSACGDLVDGGEGDRLDHDRRCRRACQGVSSSFLQAVREQRSVLDRGDRRRHRGDRLQHHLDTKLDRQFISTRTAFGCNREVSRDVFVEPEFVQPGWWTYLCRPGRGGEAQRVRGTARRCIARRLLVQVFRSPGA